MINELLTNNGMKLLKWRDVTSNVISSLESDDARKKDLVNKLPVILCKAAHEFACTTESTDYRKFKSGERCYYILMARWENSE